jgi:hypothetical protein
MCGARAILVACWPTSSSHPETADGLCAQPTPGAAAWQQRPGQGSDQRFHPISWILLTLSSTLYALGRGCDGHTPPP